MGDAGAPAWETATVRFAMDKVVLRAVLVAVAEYATFPEPDPVAPLVIVNHAAPLAAVQGQPAVAVTAIVPAPPPTQLATISILARFRML